MAKITPFGQPANDGERDAIYYLRRLPDTFEIFHNLEIKQNKETFEVDLVILAPQCVFVVDVKGTHGYIEIIGSRWYPENRQSYASPVAKLRNIAKVLSTQFKESKRLKADLGRVHVHAVTLMIAEDVEIVDRDGRDDAHITYCNEKCIKYFQSHSFIPDHRLKDIRHFFPDLKRAIHGKAQPKSSPPRYRDWQVEEELGRTDRYTEYRARHLLMGAGGWTARIRVYRADPYLPAAEREAEKKLISNAYQSVYQIPVHPNILSVKDFFAADDGDCFVLVTEDIPGQTLRQHIKKQDIVLKHKFDFIAEVLRSLDHAHKHGVIHRNLTPDNIFISTDNQVRLIGFDYARVNDRTSTIAYDIIDDLENDAVYQATECYRDPAKATVGSDLFSAGLVFYELLTNQQAFESAEQICDREAVFPVKPSSLRSEISSGIDAWLQKLCAFSPQDRFSSADAALQGLLPIATLQTVDLSNLSVDSPIDDRYIVQKRLGKPGSFAVAYKVFETIGGVMRVLKLVTRDRRSVYERLQQEYKTLLRVPKHPHIVEVIWAGHLKDETPYIVFEYVEGNDIEYLIEEQKISLEQSVQIAKQAAIGLAHLHKHGVYHQDIKPSNLILTADGVRIIDFNIAVSDGDEVSISAGTRKYMPPDIKPKLELSKTEKIDRDIYALGITFYECLTGCYPFEDPNPPLGKPPRSPREIEGFENLNEDLAQIMCQAIAAKSNERFSSAEMFLEKLSTIADFWQPEPAIAEVEPETIETADSAQGILAASASDASDELQVAQYPIEKSVLPVLETAPLKDIESSPSEHVSEPQDLQLSDVSSATDNGKSSLFDNLPPALPPQPLPDKHKAPNKLVILDPTGLYPVPSNCIEIRSEVDWMKSFFTCDGLYWISGKSLQAKRICEWTREWLRVWNKLDLIVEEKQNPRSRLEVLFGSVKIPSEWTDQQVLQLVTNLDSYGQDNPVAHLLADCVEGDRQVWFDPPSLEHLAKWTSVQVPEAYKTLERVWQNQIAENSAELRPYYQAQNKLDLLRQWLGIIESTAQIRKLGRYMRPIPKFLVGEFGAFWERQLLRTDGAALDELNPNQVPGMEQVAAFAYRLLKSRPNWITKRRKQKLYSYLSYKEQYDLDNLQPPPQPETLDLNATVSDALQWVTEQYLPFRRWETTAQNAAVQIRESDRLADSFVSWVLKHYPSMRLYPTDESSLNFSVAPMVQDLCSDAPVLWVVVDGLGWLDHQELLTYLTQNGDLSVEVALQPRISVLPTKTEYAKWSLYTQLPPSHSSWVPDAGKGFPMMKLGKRYTDRDHKKATLHQDLQNQAHSLYCWDTDQYDHLYHTEQNWQNFYHVRRSHVLEGIAKEIKYCLDQHPNPEKLRVVIASDHGQMMGEVERLSNPPEGLELKGRMAVGKTDDPRFVVLEAERYELPHDISVVRGAACLNSFVRTSNEEIIGSHGGLFPEEVVVGVSVLRQTVNRLPILVISSGEGKAHEPGELVVSIDNPNSVPLTQLCLSIRELPQLKAGHSLEVKVPAGQKISVKIVIAQLPELPPNYQGTRLPLTGELQFQFADTEFSRTALDSESAIVITQMFSSGFDIDEFF